MRLSQYIVIISEQKIGAVIKNLTPHLHRTMTQELPKCL